MFEQWLKKMTLTISALHYRVTARGVENFPADGGVLLLPNHVSYVDAIILSLASPRPVRFLSEEDFFHRPLLGRILRLFNGIPVSPRRAKDGIVKAAEALTAGEVVCIFPEGRLTRDGELSDLQAGFQLIARRAANSQIVVARIDGLWGSIFSYYGGRLFTKLPRRLVRRVTVSFSVPLTAIEATFAISGERNAPPARLDALQSRHKALRSKLLIPHPASVDAGISGTLIFHHPLLGLAVSSVGLVSRRVNGGAGNDPPLHITADDGLLIFNHECSLMASFVVADQKTVYAYSTTTGILIKNKPDNTATINPIYALRFDCLRKHREDMTHISQKSGNKYV